MARFLMPLEGCEIAVGLATNTGMHNVVMNRALVDLEVVTVIQPFVTQVALVLSSRLVRAIISVRRTIARWTSRILITRFIRPGLHSQIT